jgi:hypothetical protein
MARKRAWSAIIGAAMLSATSPASTRLIAGDPPPVEAGDLLAVLQHFAMGGNDALYSVDDQNGSVSGRCGLSGPFTMDVEYRQDGALYASHLLAPGIYQLSPETCDFTLVGTTSGRVTALEFDGDTLYGALQIEDESSSLGIPTDLVLIDATDGSTTPIGPMGMYVGGLAFDPEAEIMYALGGFGGSTLYTVDLGTGALTPVGSTGRSLDGLDFRADGVLFSGSTSIGSGSVSRLFAISTLTGLATEVGPTGIDGASMDGLTFVPGVLFADGFENGNPDRWSETVLN